VLPGALNTDDPSLTQLNWLVSWVRSGAMNRLYVLFCLSLSFNSPVCLWSPWDRPGPELVFIAGIPLRIFGAGFFYWLDVPLSPNQC